MSTDWLEHMQYKNWFRVRTFLPAYVEALCRQKKECVISYVAGRKIILEPLKLRDNKSAMENMIKLLEIRIKQNLSSYGRLQDEYVQGHCKGAGVEA